MDEAKLEEGKTEVLDKLHTVGTHMETALKSIKRLTMALSVTLVLGAGIEFWRLWRMWSQP